MNEQLQRFLARIEDLPYHTSPPVQYTYRSTANLSAGKYVWADAPTDLIPQRPLLQNTLYYIRNISLSADVDQYDFMSNILVTDIPSFYMFQYSHKNAVLFREPVRMSTFLDQFMFRQTVLSQQSTDKFMAGFRGTLLQGANLIGKSTVTLVSVMSVQEIVDEGFIKLFVKKFPDGRF